MPHQRKQIIKAKVFSSEESSNDEQFYYLEENSEENVFCSDLNLRGKTEPEVLMPWTTSCKSVLPYGLAEIVRTDSATTTIAVLDSLDSDLSELSTSVKRETISPDIELLASSVSPDLQLSVPSTSAKLVPISSNFELSAPSISSGEEYVVSTTTVNSLSSTSPSSQKRIPTKQSSTVSKRARVSRANSDSAKWDTEHFQPPVVNEFSAPSGVQCNVNVKSTPLECFRHFFDDEIIEIIVTETNRYANNLINNIALSPCSRLKKWKDITPSEIWEFLALIILMGTVKKPTMSLYFSRDPMYSMPIFGATTTKNRFLSFLSNLKFSNSTEVTRDECIHEIKSISDKLCQNFQKNYLPKEHVCVDESLMLWKGQLGFRQYIPTKRAKIGMKSYELCESLSGYVWNFLIYTGSSTIYTDDADSQGERIVMTLMEPLLGKNYKVYVDRFFSSPTLAERLLEAQTYMCGTVKKCRVGMPKNFPSVVLKRGEMKACQKNNISVFTWMDKREVNLISTMSDNTFTETTKRDRETNELILKPTCIVQYNKYMGGVDLCDSLIHAYPSIRKTLKWYKKVFFHMIDISLYNAWVIYKSLGNNVPLLKFRQHIIQVLLGNHRVSRTVGGKWENPFRLTERHFPVIYKASKGKYLYKRCKLCYLRKQRKATKLLCPECNIALCAYPCFRIYHTELSLTF